MIPAWLSLAALGGLGVALGQGGASVMLIRPGTFHQNEIAARTGERWLGLVPGPTGFSSRYFRVVTRAVHDNVIDEPGQTTGIEVAVAGAEPVFLVRGLDFVHRRVPTALYSPEGRMLADSGVIELSCEGCGRYRLRVLNRPTEYASAARHSMLVLESADGRQQILHEWPSGLVDQHCEIVWAGDFDGDGKLDLFMDVSDHYNEMVWRLFLSSKAEKRQLVGLVALLRVLGC